MDIYSSLDLPFIRTTIQNRLRDGDVAILPTDTLYGLSGDASNPLVVNAILDIKQRNSPISIVPPSMAWLKMFVKSNLNLDDLIYHYHGPYTLLLPYSPQFLKLPTPLCSSGLVGVRFPDHWISQLAESINKPLLTTSVNISGQPPMQSLEDLSSVISRKIDFIVYEGKKENSPSTIFKWEHGQFQLQPR